METNKKKRLILLIEDEEVMVNLLQNKFAAAGYDIQVARNGASGVEMVRKLNPDMVLLDMLLPQLNGFDVLETLSRENILPSLPIIIISNSGQPIETERAIKLGVKDYIIKINFDPNEILSKVENILGSQYNNSATSTQKNFNITVLLVEDDTFLVELLERKFSQSNIKTLWAMDAEKARSVLDSEKIDIIVLDILLPGTNGIDFLKEIKANAKHNNIPVIIVSNLGQREEIQKGMDAGASFYIIKAHADAGEIVEKIQELAGK